MSTMNRLVSRRDMFAACGTIGAVGGVAAVLAGCTSTSDQTTSGSATDDASSQTSANTLVFQQDQAIVQIDAGSLRGYIDNDVYTFKGIPYATAGRFEEPTSPDAWDGIRDVQIYGDMCPQTEMTGGASEALNPHLFWPQASDETAIQTLNIWTTQLDTSAKMPVMFWIHGGGFSTGASTEQIAYDGRNMADLGEVVVVSINHRLNCLGYLDLSSYGDEFAHSGNLGQMDIVAALEWVQTNIEQFGGDPDNVTVFGQSGGGRKILNLMGTPSASGLFHKAICESCGQQSIPQETAQRIGQRTVEKLGLSASTIDEIKTVAYEELLEAGTAALTEIGEEDGASYAWSPVVDGDFMPVDIWLDDNLGDTAQDIPLIIGSVFAETTTNAFTYVTGAYVDKNALSDDEVDELLEGRFGDEADAVAEAFTEAYPGKSRVDAAYVDLTNYRGIVLDVADARAAQGAPTYNYVFALEYPTMGGWLPWHCSELPLVFHNLDTVRLPFGGPNEATLRVQEEIFGAWMAFAKTGDPNHDDLVEWPQYNEDGAAMIFEEESFIGYHHDQEFRELALAATQ